MTLREELVTQGMPVAVGDGEKQPVLEALAEVEAGLADVRRRLVEVGVSPELLGVARDAVKHHPIHLLPILLCDD